MSKPGADNNSSRISSYEALIAETFEPDQNGISKWVKVETLIAKGFKWTKNGNIRRGRPAWDKKYIWKFQRKSESEKSEILALRTDGFNTEDGVSSSIRKDIMDQLRNSGICNFSLLPVPVKDREVDHRFGFKEHPKYAHINVIAKQKISDFQLLHHAQNVQKRQMCVECVASRKRPSHPEKEFAIGNQELNDVIVCDGCYLAQPELYR